MQPVQPFTRGRGKGGLEFRRRPHFKNSGHQTQGAGGGRQRLQ